MEAGAVWIWERARRRLERVELHEGRQAGVQPR
jgi:hypothetical protein